MAFPEAFLEELKMRAGLAEVIGRRVRLLRRGRELVGLCPFHDEKTPSFTVNESKGFYHCFGCGAHGGVLDFVMGTEGLGFRDAVERLAAEVGLAVPSETPADRARADRRASLLDVTEAAAKWFETRLRLPEGKIGLAYFQKRGLDDETIGRFRLGYAPDSRNALKAALARDGVDEQRMVEAGLLIVPDEPGRVPYDRFRGRVMFPITDRRGRVIAFGGRVIGAGEPKYLNSPETPLFHKGRMLYGLDHAAKAAADAGTMIVAEGYMDVISLSKAGFPHAVAPLGTALTEEQLDALWRLVPEPVLLFDPDAAGRRAALRAAERALPRLAAGNGLKFAFVETQTGDDPDGVARRYPKDFLENALRGALSLSEMLYWSETHGRSIDTPEDRAAVEARLRAHAARAGDATVRRHLHDAFRERLRPAFGGARSRPRQPQRRSIPGIVARSGPTEAGEIERRREMILLAVAITHPEACEVIGERLGTLTFRSPELDSLRQEVLSATDSIPNLDAAALESHLCCCGFSAILESVLGPRTFSDAFFAKPGAPLETAISGWDETYALYRRRDLRIDIEDRKRDLVERLSADDFERFASLKQQENEGSN